MPKPKRDPVTRGQSTATPSHQDDFLSRPYEEWAESTEAIEEIKRRNSESEAQPGWVSVLCSLLLLPMALIGTGFLLDRPFVPARGVEQGTWAAVGVLSLLGTTFIAVAKLRGKVSLRWFYVLLSLPVGLFIGLVLVLPLVLFVGRTWTAFAHDAADGHLVIYSSKHGGGRGCRFRNNFYVRGFDGESFWCSREPLTPGVYATKVKLSGVGALVLCEVDNNAGSTPCVSDSAHPAGVQLN